MNIALDIEEGDIERIVTSLDNQHAYTRSRNLEDSGYERLADLFRGFLKRDKPRAPLRISRCDSSGGAKILFELVYARN